MKHGEIKETRINFGLTQNKMAKLLGMAQPSLARIESGRRHETKGHIAHLIALDLIFEHGLLEDLISKLKE